MWPTWILLRTSLTGFSLPLTRMVEGQLTLRKSGAVLTSLFDFRVGIHFIFFQGVRISCILLVSQFLLSFSSFTFGKRGSLELDLNGINIHQTQFFFFPNIPLKANAASCKTVKFSPAPDTRGNRAIQICRPLAWPDLNKSPKNLPLYKNHPTTRDIVVGLFRLAGIEEDEDLIFACVSDVRSQIRRTHNCHSFCTNNLKTDKFSEQHCTYSFLKSKFSPYI